MKPTLVILAAGMGTRYGGLKQVEAMGPHGEAILEYSVFDAVRAGFGKIVFVIREDIERAFRDEIGKRFPAELPVDYAFQRLDDLPHGYAVPDGRTKPWGTAHAVRAARSAVQEPFAAINADDFYGRQSFEVLARFLSQSGLEGAACRNCMVGFRLRNTLSEFGSVARGICELDSSEMLVSVEELTDIYRTESGAGEDRPKGGERRPLSGGAIASMNMWGFSTAIFERMEDAFESFLHRQGGLLKSEFYITTMMDSLIRSEKEGVKVLKTDSDWFGVTYQEDKLGVVKSIADLVAGRQYPAPLWE